MAVISLNYPELLNCSQSPQIITLGARVFLWKSVRSDTWDKIEIAICRVIASLFLKTQKKYCVLSMQKKKQPKLEIDFIVTSSADRFTMDSRTIGK